MVGFVHGFFGLWILVPCPLGGTQWNRFSSLEAKPQRNPSAPSGFTSCEDSKIVEIRCNDLLLSSTKSSYMRTTSWMRRHHSGTNGHGKCFGFKRILFTATWSARRMRCIWCHGDDLRSASELRHSCQPFHHLRRETSGTWISAFFKPWPSVSILSTGDPFYQDRECIAVYSRSRWLWHHSSADKLDGTTPMCSFIRALQKITS